jgi:hypothetical protein
MANIKIKILKQCFMSTVLPDGKKARKDCFPGEVIDVENIHNDDIKAGIYKPYNEIITRERQQVPSKLILPEGLNLNSTIANLQSAISGAVTVLNAIQGISQASNQIVEEPKEETILQMTESSEQEIVVDDSSIYTDNDLRKRNNTVSNMIRANVMELDNQGRELHSIDCKTKTRSRLPIFAEQNIGKIKYSGKVEIMPELKGTDILDNTPVELKNMVNSKGNTVIDVFSSLGARTKEVAAHINIATLED